MVICLIIWLIVLSLKYQVFFQRSMLQSSYLPVAHHFDHVTVVRYNIKIDKFIEWFPSTKPEDGYTLDTNQVPPLSLGIFQC